MFLEVIIVMVFHGVFDAALKRSRSFCHSDVLQYFTPERFLVVSSQLEAFQHT